MKYESQVHAYLERELPTYFAGPLLQFEDDTGPRCAIPDGLLISRTACEARSPNAALQAEGACGAGSTSTADSAEKASGASGATTSVSENDGGGTITLFEIKYSHMPEAWWQLRRLYQPLVETLFHAPFWHINVVEVCRSFDPAVSFPEEVELIHGALAPWTRVPQPRFGVWKWRSGA